VTTKTKNFIRALVVCMITISIIGLPQQASARTSVRMKQRIRPIPCGIDHLTDANGIDHYFAPRACGKLVTPPSDTSGGSSSLTGSGGQNIVGNMPTYLDTKNHVVGDDAYLVLAKKGQVFTFRLSGDSALSPQRTMEVRQITNKSATFMFTPGDKETTLLSGGRIDADIAFSQDPDISIRVKDISEEGLISMQIWFPVQCVLECTVNDTVRPVVAVGILGTLTTFAGFSHFHSRRRML
jgi:hypothetical protein